MIQAVSSRSRASVLALLSMAALSLGGCGQQAHATPPSTQAAAVAAPDAAPPVSTVTLPPAPAPVPATFDVAALSERVRPMVVNITTTHESSGREGLDPFEFFFGPQGGRGAPRGGPRPTQTALGTGFIIDPSGYVVTNEHVIHEASGVRVRLADEREFEAEVVGRDPKLDLALLRLKGASGLPVAPLGTSEQLRVGEHVLAVGNPFGLGHTVTLGIVSAKARAIGAGPYDDFIQTDASINPGNSGGPLFNWRGEVVGINTAIRAGANGIGFAIPIDALKDVLPQLREKGFVERGKLGLLFQPVTRDLAAALKLDSPRGALVAELEPGGAAARAGIKAGDVIVEVNGVPIVHAEELRRNVARNAPGSEIKVTVVRAEKRHEVVARLDALQDEEGDAASRPRPTQGARPDRQQSAEKLGIQVSDAAGGGVRVDGFAPGINVQEIQVGDVILEINGAPVKDVAGLRAAIAKVKDGSVALLKVRRGKVVQFAAVPLPAR
ncbi:Do family serine endopeptidase [Sorangium cellulosum]|uniref:Serine protease n=1 Tax=Sorangium cellulosum TaxID=56 RepID=A0A150QK73_SORCE|nr:Do family serine endopeptidase [Sorangium cellulosum]KYF68096.1 serine protease [Sorangium cellulosum]